NVSLRNAVQIANASTTSTDIVFDASVFAIPRTIVLTKGVLNLNNAAHATSISAPAGGLTVSGNDKSGVFMIGAGATATITGIRCGGSGGGFNCYAGTATLTNATVSGNSAGFGGGVYNLSVLTLGNVTIAGNRSSAQGGGIFNGDDVTLRNVTIARNTSG